MAANKLSNLTQRVIPKFVSDEYPAFETFVKSYFEYLEQDLGEYDSVANLLNYRDIDETIDSFIEQFRFEKAPLLSPTASASLRLLIKKIKLFYKVKGTEAGFTFLYRAIFDSAVTFFYPKIDILRTSDSTTVLNDDKIQDSHFWQDFSYEIQSDVQRSAFYDKMIRDLVHPAGLKYFTRLSFDAEQPTMAGVDFMESLVALIITSIGNMSITLTEEILDLYLVKIKTQSLLHSTSYVESNLEDDAKMSRMGLFSLNEMDNLPLWTLQGRAGTSMGIMFTDGLKDQIDNYSIVDDTFTMDERAAGQRIDLIKLPLYKKNVFQNFVGDGAQSTFKTDFASNNKGNVFLFINGLKQTQSNFTVSGDLLTLGAPPNNGAIIEYYLVEHTAEIINTNEYISTYILDKETKNQSIFVFALGKLRESGVDYTLNTKTNEITPIGLPSNVVLEVVYVPLARREIFLTDGSAINSPYTIYNLQRRLDAFNVRGYSDILTYIVPPLETVALLHFEGADGGQIFTDEAHNDWGNVNFFTTSNTLSKFGTTSLAISSSTTGLSTAGIKLLEDTHTVEGWFYPTLADSTTRCLFSSGGVQVSYKNGYFGLANSQVEQFAHQDASPINNWYHIAIVSDAGTQHLYVNGVKSTSSVSLTNFYNYQPITLFIGGAGGNSSYRFVGYIDECRVVNRTAVYTENFAPPTSAFSAPAIITSSIVHFDGTNGSQVYTDEIGDFVWTQQTSTGAIDTTRSKFGTASFGVSGNSYPIHGTRNFGLAKTFTIECWVYPTSNTSYNTVFGTYPNSQWPIYIGLENNQFNLGINGTTHLTHQDTTDKVNKWTHLALVYTDGVAKLYVDGIGSDTTYANTTFYYNNSGFTIRVGESAWNGSSWQGNIDEFRITDRAALYTADFTPPTEPFV